MKVKNFQEFTIREIMDNFIHYFQTKYSGITPDTIIDYYVDLEKDVVLFTFIDYVKEKEEGR